MRAPILFLAALAASLGAAPASAEAIYKWVDADGVVHYSNSRPSSLSQKVEVLAEDRISIYQSEPAMTRAAAQAAPQSRTDYLARRVDTLERELAAQRQAARAAADAEARAMQAAYEQCLADRRVDCGGAGYAAPYVIYAGPLLPARRIPVRNSRFQPINSITGLTAGNVVTFRPATAPRTGHVRVAAGTLRTR